MLTVTWINRFNSSETRFTSAKIKDGRYDINYLRTLEKSTRLKNSPFRIINLDGTITSINGSSQKARKKKLIIELNKKPVVTHFCIFLYNNNNCASQPQSTLNYLHHIFSTICSYQSYCFQLKAPI